MITEDMVRSGIREHLITFIVDPNMGSGTVCSIGDSWFYFGGYEAVLTYWNKYTEGNKVRLIF